MGVGGERGGHGGRLQDSRRGGDLHALCYCLAHSAGRCRRLNKTQMPLKTHLWQQNLNHPLLLLLLLLVAALLLVLSVVDEVVVRPPPHLPPLSPPPPPQSPPHTDTQSPPHAQTRMTPPPTDTHDPPARPSPTRADRARPACPQLEHRQHRQALGPLQGAGGQALLGLQQVHLEAGVWGGAGGGRGSRER